MHRVVFLLICTAFLTSIVGQDTLILNSGEYIPCTIKWENPHKYKVTIHSVEFEEVFGKQFVFGREKVNAIRDQGSHRAMKGFGKVKITMLDGSPKLTHKLYSTTPTSVVCAIAEFKNKAGERVITTKSVPATRIKNIRWIKSHAAAGAVVGGVIGLAGGIYAGHEVYDLTYDSKDSYVVLPLIFTAAGSGIGALAGHLTSLKKRIEINGDPAIWSRERHRFPPYPEY